MCSSDLIIEIKGNTDNRLVTLAVAHGLNINRKALVLTDSVEYCRIGESMGQCEGGAEVYRCGEVYVVIEPQLFVVRWNENDEDDIDEGLNALEGLVADTVDDASDLLGEEFDTVLISWSNPMRTEFGIRIELYDYKVGIVTKEENQYIWETGSEGKAEDTGVTKYVVFYDKKDVRKFSDDGIERVIVNEKETKLMRSIEKTGKLKLITGGYFAIAEDIAVKLCGVSAGAFKGILSKFA